MPFTSHISFTTDFHTYTFKFNALKHTGSVRKKQRQLQPCPGQLSSALSLLQSGYSGNKVSNIRHSHQEISH
uniref:Uncharacterized protein n=1 Tax=Anguilla anguilla TaxID=7936 RepID=A0A0E9WM78_ANGAN